MVYIPCHERKFPLILQPLAARIRASYSFWLKHLVERLGCENARQIWADAFVKYDLKFLGSIISSGWTEVKPDDSPDEMKTPDVFGTYVGNGKQGMSVSDARSIVEDTPPLRQISDTFPDLNIQRDTTTYEALHLYAHGMALMTETLIDRFGKEGELIAYDILHASRSDLGKRVGGTVEDYFRQSEEELDTPGVYSAGLEIEKVSSSDTESVMRVKECEWARYFRERHPGVGYLVACSTDEAYVRGFNESLRLQRTSTLMEGGEFCDFRFYVLEGTPDKS